MAKKKKSRIGMTSTKTMIEEFEDEQREESDEPGPIIPAPEPGRYTLEQIIERFRRNPHPETFWVPPEFPPGFSIATRDKFIKFKDSHFTTSDPVEIEILLRANDPGAKYNVHFFAMNPELRNLKKS